MQARYGHHAAHRSCDGAEEPQQSALVDKLTLIRAYEQTLRNQGQTPVEDCRIYKLLFRTVHDSEQYLSRNVSYVKSRKMAGMERLSLLQNQL